MIADSTMPVVAQELSAAIDRFEGHDVLKRLDDLHDGGALARPLAGLLRARALVSLERYVAAHEVLGEVRAMRDLGDRERIEAQVLGARVLRHASSMVDEAIARAHAASEGASRGGDGFASLAVDARIEAALLFARKRCRKLAEREFERASSCAGISTDDRGRLHAARAALALSFDERAAAKTELEGAVSLGGASARLGHLGLARLHTVLGEFDAAERELEAIGKEAPGDLAVKRARKHAAASRGKWLAVVAAIDSFLAASPDADCSRGFRLERASAFYRAEAFDRAREAWAELAESSEHGDWAARTASRTLAKLEKAEAQVRRTRLSAFPSVAQLRNHCGPASVELCLRFFCVTADQVTVAREIKHPDGGTPVHKMRAYLEGAGFIARRIEADPVKLRAILDAGVPVIIEEDYSTTRHVAVAVGYDDRREILEVQDPMTHEIRETPYEELAKLREFSNHGALVAVPRDRAELLAKLDACGAVECEYMTKTDLAWEAYDQKRFDDGDGLVDQAIASHEAYELAWVYRYTRARDRYDEEPTPANKEAVGEVLNGLLELWPDDEWPQQFLGRTFVMDDRWDEALGAFERARDRDPDDANNWSSIGDCQNQLGQRDEAKKSFEEALRRDPGHVRANENLSNALLDAGDTALAATLNECALELHPENPFNHHVRGRILAKRGDPRAAADAYAQALELAPSSQYYTVERARHLAKAGKVDAALASLEKAADAVVPEDVHYRVQLADLAYEHDRTDACLAACALVQERTPESATPRAIGGAARAKRGELEEGLALLREAIRMNPTYAWAYREMGSALGRVERHEEAVAACAAATGFNGNAITTFYLGDALALAGFVDSAIIYLKRAANTGELGEREIERVGAVVRQGEGGGAAHQFFAQLGERYPRDPGVLRAHARLLMGTLWYPGTATPLLSRLSELAPKDPLVLAKSGDDLMDASIEAEARGEELLRKAIERAPEMIAPRRLLARQLQARGRFVDALEVLERCPADDETMEDRVVALIGARREGEARAAIDAYVAPMTEDARGKTRRPLDYRIAKAARRFDEALPLAEALSQDDGELPDDGELGRWEAERFASLVALGRSEEAYSFGTAQCADADDRGRLAYDALVHDDMTLASRLARAALEEDADEVHALHIVARAADLAGDVAEATHTWERMRAISKWHIHVENLGRLALAAGDMTRARELLEASVATGHLCPVSLQLRAQLRLLTGDRDGAKADAVRARDCLQLELRGVSEQLDAIVAGLDGKRDEARTLFEKFLAREKLAKSDLAVYAKVREALGA